MSSTIIAQGLSAIPLNDLDAVSGAQFKYSNIFGNQRLDSLFHTIELIPIDNLHDESLGVSNISYRFRGQSLDESRKFQFTCTFTIGNEETQNSRLSSLDIILETPLSVTEPSSSLKAFVSQCCESLDLVSALHGIDSFAKLYLKRSAIIQRLSQLYGKDTLLTNCPHGDFYAFPTTVKGPGKQTKGYYLLSDEWKFLLKWEIGIKPFQHNSSADAHSIIKGSLIPLYPKSYSHSGSGYAVNLDDEARKIADGADVRKLSKTERDYITRFPVLFSELIRMNGILKAVATVYEILSKKRPLKKTKPV